MRSLLVLIWALTLASESAWARSAGSSTHHSSHSSSSSFSGGHAAGTHSSGSQTSHAAVGAPRDSHSHIKRSEPAKDQFEKSHHCPSTGNSSDACPGYVVDHVTPLKRAEAPTRRAICNGGRKRWPNKRIAGNEKGPRVTKQQSAQKLVMQRETVIGPFSQRQLRCPDHYTQLSG